MGSGKATNWAFSPESRRAFSHAEGRVQVWDVATGSEVHSWEDPGGKLHVSPDNRLLASVPSDSTEPSGHVYEIATGRRVCRFPQVGMLVLFAPDGKLLVNIEVLGKRAIRVDAATGASSRIAIPANAMIEQAAVSRAGRLLGMSLSDQTVRVYDLATCEEARVLRGHTFGVRCLDFYPDGSRIVSGGQDGKVKVWDLRHAQQGIVAATELGGSEWGGALTFRDKGRNLAVARHDGQPGLASIDPSTDRPIVRRALALNRNSKVPRHDTAFSADGEQFAGISTDGQDACVWEVATGRELMRIPTQPEALRSLALSGDACLLVTASQSSASGPAEERVELKVWDVPTGTQRAALSSAPVLSLAFSADGRRVALGPEDGQIHLWHWDTPAPPRVLPGRCDGLAGIAFSPDGSQLAACERGKGLVRVWDLERGVPLFADERASGLAGPLSLTCVTFSPDGRRIGAIGYNGVAFLWDAQTGQELLSLRTLGAQRLGDYAYNARLRFSPDGKRLAANHWLGGVTIWDTE